MDGQLALGIGLGILAISVPLTALILIVMPRRIHPASHETLRDQDRVRGVELTSAGQTETLVGVKVHLSSIDGRLERIEKKLYGT